MTSHLEEGVLQELLDGEIPSSELLAIQAHLASCAECRARLDEARAIGAEADRLIESIKLTGQDPLRRATVPWRARPARWGRDLAWAATVVVAVGAGYLARGTGPASPLRQENAAPVPAAPVFKANPTDQPNEPAEPLASKATDAVAERRADRLSAANLSARKAAPAPAALSKTEQSAAVEGKLATAPQEKGKDSSDSTRLKRTLGDTPLRLEEIVTTSTAESARPAGGIAARKAAPSPPATQPLAARANEIQLDQGGNLSRRARREATPVEITFSEGRLRLGGALRQIEGMVLLRLEVLEPYVRVVYGITDGELILEQRLEDGRITYRLVAPSSFPVDSLERLRARVRE